MDKVYNPQQIEQTYYSLWEQAGCFELDSSDDSKAPYCIMLPPPNITGSLHMGHAFQHTLMDVLTRYHKMCGRKVLWQPGTDHAGIATQMVVERQLEAQGQNRHDIGRKHFVEKVWQWKVQSGGHITQQMRCLGNSLAWKQERFTMDEGLSNATQTAFLKLYEDGLIYRGKRLVNWDIKFQSAISDLEVVNKEEQGKLYHIHYRLQTPHPSVGDYLVVATTRPETLFGDVAVAVHPEDVRFSSLVGQFVKLPLTDRLIPVVADDYVDPSFGTGCLKITPAHDFNDHQVGKRHGFEPVNILSLDGTFNERMSATYRGQDRLAAREKIVADLDKQNLLGEVLPHTLKRPYGDRSNTVIEPMLTDQWFVRTKPLAEKAIKVVKNKQIEFIPTQWEKTYFQWMESIDDWCISRQIWWGHRVPAWYDETGNVFVAADEKSAQIQAQQHHQTTKHVSLKQDEDVLDTWFSSALWPFSTLGWPKNTQALQTFYPTSVLVTGFDIIFFWVARMVMMGVYFCQDVPFKQVYITGLIRDHRGQKMSKSKGNVIDPIDLIDGIDLDSLVQKRTQGLMQPHLKKTIEKTTKTDYPKGIEGFGADALRFSLMAEAGGGRDISFNVNEIRGYRNFCNKIWNAARFCHLQFEGQVISPSIEFETLGVFDQWVLARLNEVIERSHHYLAVYRFDQLAALLYDFIWHEFCDWYLEAFKIGAQQQVEKIANSHRVLLEVLETILRLMHPVTPFLTESIWQSLKPFSKQHDDFLVHCDYPQLNQKWVLSEIGARQIKTVQSVVKTTRQFRTDLGILPHQPLKAVCLNDNNLDDHAQLAIKRLAKIERIQTDRSTGVWVAASFGFVLLEAGVDVSKRLLKIEQLINQKEKYLVGQAKKINNDQFKQRAAQTVIERENTLYKNVQHELSVLVEQQKRLQAIG